MKLEIDIPEHHYNNIIALDSVSLGRVPYKGIIMYTINAIKHGRVLDQEPIKPMVEIDLYSVIKQKYIEREVLDKIRKQIKSHLRGVEITLEVLVENDPLRPKMEGAKDTLEECLNLIDKAESEDKVSNSKKEKNEK